MVERRLTVEQARALYDRIGSRQDTQEFYERAAVDRLIAHGNFRDATSIVEFGCGTGALARRLLTDQLAHRATYLALDVSPIMAAEATARLAPWHDRADVVVSDGLPALGVADRSVDRVVSTYVLDLLADSAIAALLDDARRALSDHGLLCLASLTPGASGVPRAVSRLWSEVARHRPEWTGGCRPLDVSSFLTPLSWRIDHLEVVASYGISSQVLVASPRR